MAPEQIIAFVYMLHLYGAQACSSRLHLFAFYICDCMHLIFVPMWWATVCNGLLGTGFGPVPVTAGYRQLFPGVTFTYFRAYKSAAIYIYIYIYI